MRQPQEDDPRVVRRRVDLDVAEADIQRDDGSAPLCLHTCDDLIGCATQLLVERGDGVVARFAQQPSQILGQVLVYLEGDHPAALPRSKMRSRASSAA